MENTFLLEQLITAGILQFGEVSQLDIQVLKDWLADDYTFKILNFKTPFEGKYITSTQPKDEYDPWSAERFFLNPSYSLSANVSTNDGEFSLKKRLELSQGAFLSMAFEKFDIRQFVLKKIKMIPNLTEEDFPVYFSDVQLTAILKLKMAGIDVFNADPNDLPIDCPVLSKEAKDKIGYIKLPKEWRKDKSSLIYQLLTTCKENTIYLCYPNELLKNKIDLSVNDVNIAWADIDVDTMKTFYDYRKFCSSESKNALDYIICALNGKTHYKKNTKVRYVAVMERDSEDRYLLRGIIKSDDNGFYVLLNPLLKEYLDSIKKPDESPETEIIKEYKP